MNLSDQEFREEFKPLTIPSEFDSDDSIENKVVFALAITGRGTAAEVALKLQELEPGSDPTYLLAESTEVLDALFEKGLLRGTGEGEEREYDLGKITDENKGYTDPNLLAPGLD